MLSDISIWEPKKLAFIGMWWDHVRKADILAHIKKVDAQWIGATLIDVQGNKRALLAAGFEPIAYGVRNGYSGYIQLWRAKNPFFPAKIEPGYTTWANSLNTFCCGMYAHAGAFTPKRVALFRPPQLHLGNGRPRALEQYAFEFCPGWWCVGRKGRHPDFKV